MPPSVNKDDDSLKPISEELQALREELLAAETELADTLQTVHADNLPSARNLVHYLAVRRYDIRPLQSRLARAGLSSLGGSESHVLASLDSVLNMLSLAGVQARRAGTPPIEFGEGEGILAENAQRLLGSPPEHRNVRIAVTLPTEAADDPRFASDLIAAGMDCARINCARDDAATWSKMADNVHAAARANGRECRLLVDLSGPKLRTGTIAGGAKRLLLSVGDQFELVSDGDGRLAREKCQPRIACSAPEIFDLVQPGQPIWFDDGELGGVIEKRTAAGLLIRVTTAAPAGSKLRSRRGINLPDTQLSFPALTAKDREDLGAVVAWADVIELSFVQRSDDVLALHDALRSHKADHIGVVLKIETRGGFAELPQLLLTAMQWRDCGVMIARGDLAVEVGFERMAEIQEEVLWIAEAAHVPTIWATKVLDTLAKTGSLSRAEMTDAAMSARAEAVLLNKGEFVIDAIVALDDILTRMKEHQAKKRPLLRALHVSGNLWD